VNTYLNEFRFYKNEDGPGVLICNFCDGSIVKKYIQYNLGIVPSLLELLKDAEEHFDRNHNSISPMDISSD